MKTNLIGINIKKLDVFTEILSSNCTLELHVFSAIVNDFSELKAGDDAKDAKLWSFEVASLCPCMLLLNDVVRMPHSSAYNPFTTRSSV